MRVTGRIASLAGLILALAWCTGATTARRLSNEDLATQADLIVIGKSVDSRSEWMDRTLVTVVTISVSETLKGTTGATLTVVLPGGVDARRAVPIAMTYAGAPAVGPDEEVVLFLDYDAQVGYTVMGFSQGKFSITEDPQGQKVVARDLTKLNLETAAGVKRGTTTVTPLSDFKREIKRHLSRKED